ncbi:hypothetical protein D9M71_370870 [compost metagenome]
MPSSITAKRRRWPFSSCARRFTSRRTSPSSVNFTALATRLLSTWRRNCSAPRQASCTCGSMCRRRQVPFSSARGSSRVSTSSSSWRREKSSGSGWLAPSSSLAKLSTSLRIASSPSPAWDSACSRRRSCSPSGAPRSSSAMPRMPLSGVRISWLMVARKRVLARLAASASSLARRRLAVRRSTRRCSSSRLLCRAARSASRRRRSARIAWRMSSSAWATVSISSCSSRSRLSSRSGACRSPPAMLRTKSAITRRWRVTRLWNSQLSATARPQRNTPIHSRLARPPCQSRR